MKRELIRSMFCEKKKKVEYLKTLDSSIEWFSTLKGKFWNEFLAKKKW